MLDIVQLSNRLWETRLHSFRGKARSASPLGYVGASNSSAGAIDARSVAPPVLVSNFYSIQGFRALRVHPWLPYAAPSALHCDCADTLTGGRGPEKRL